MIAGFAAVGTRKLWSSLRCDTDQTGGSFIRQFISSHTLVGIEVGSVLVHRTAVPSVDFYPVYIIGPFALKGIPRSTKTDINVIMSVC